MNNMKRLIAVMMVLTIALCFVACTQPQDTPSTTTTAPEKPEDPTPSSSTKTEEPEVPDYIVYVVDQDGNPVTNAMVLLCDDGMCYAPVSVNENGAAEFFFENDIVGAKAKIHSAPGYTADAMENMDAEGYLVFAEGENTLTLTVTKAAE